MLARCSRCESTFVTSTFGRQRCPKCNGEVFVADPMQPDADPGSPTLGAHDAPVFAEGERIPWERRHELGFFKALAETMKLALSEPSAFFTRVGPESTDGAHLYFFLVVCVPGIIQAIGGWVITKLGPTPEKQLAELHKQVDPLLQMMSVHLPPDIDNTVRHYLEQSSSIAGLVETMVEIPIAAFIVLYISAGAAHLTLKLLGSDKGGWNTTFKVFVYGFSPGPLVLLPWCGGLLMFLWAAGLQIIGLSKAHKASMGAATAAVLSVDIVAVGCCCLPLFALAMMGMQAAFAQ